MTFSHNHYIDQGSRPESMMIVCFLKPLFIFVLFKQVSGKNLQIIIEPFTHTLVAFIKGTSQQHGGLQHTVLQP